MLERHWRPAPSACPSPAAPIDELLQLVRCHAAGDWGTVDAHDRAANELALRDGARLLSAYTLGRACVWIITEADRSSTCILLPEEY